MDQPVRVFYCDCGQAEVVPPQVKRQVLAELNASGVPFEALADLCRLAARKDAALRRIAATGDACIAACFPRAVKWLFHAGNAPLTRQGVKVLNMREQNPDEVMPGLLSDLPAPQEQRR